MAIIYATVLEVFLLLFIIVSIKRLQQSKNWCKQIIKNWLVTYNFICSVRTSRCRCYISCMYVCSSISSLERTHTNARAVLSARQVSVLYLLIHLSGQFDVFDRTWLLVLIDFVDGASIAHIVQFSELFESLSYLCSTISLELAHFANHRNGEHQRINKRCAQWFHERNKTCHSIDDKIGYHGKTYLFTK